MGSAARIAIVQPTCVSSQSASAVNRECHSSTPNSSSTAATISTKSAGLRPGWTTFMVDAYWFSGKARRGTQLISPAWRSLSSLLCRESPRHFFADAHHTAIARSTPKGKPVRDRTASPARWAIDRLLVDGIFAGVCQLKRAQPRGVPARLISGSRPVQHDLKRFPGRNANLWVWCEVACRSSFVHGGLSDYYMISCIAAGGCWLMR